jgi:hypothetical protein
MSPFALRLRPLNATALGNESAFIPPGISDSVGLVASRQKRLGDPLNVLD